MKAPRDTEGETDGNIGNRGWSVPKSWALEGAWVIELWGCGLANTNFGRGLRTKSEWVAVFGRVRVSEKCGDVPAAFSCVCGCSLVVVGRFGTGVDLGVHGCCLDAQLGTRC